MWWAQLLNSIAALLSGGAGGGVAGSYESIATFTGDGSAATYTFSSIPSTYTSLQLRCFTNDGSGNFLNLRFNGDTGANYVWHRLQGNGTSASATATTASTQARIGYNTAGSNVFNASIADIHNYAITTQNKTVRCFNGYDSGGGADLQAVQLWSSLWQNTAAITSLTVFSAANFATGSKLALYGIKGV
jgi:hypothetical protein